MFHFENLPSYSCSKEHPHTGQDRNFRGALAQDRPSFAQNDTKRAIRTTNKTQLTTNPKTKPLKN